MLLILFPLLLSCNKLRDVVLPGGGILTPPGFLLKEMSTWDKSNGERRWFFYYNAWKELDSIKVIDSAVIWPDMVTMHAFVHYFRVSYKTPGCMDTVKLFDPAGKLVYTETDFKYDKLGRVTSYIYNILYWDDPVPPTPVSYTYNSNGAVVRNREKQDTAFYDSHQNVTEWHTNLWDLRFSYDQWFNPLFYVKNLTIITEEGWFYEFAMSKHNVVHTQYDDGRSVTYENIYDTQHRLIEKRFIHPASQSLNIFKFKY